MAIMDNVQDFKKKIMRNQSMPLSPKSESNISDQNASVLLSKKEFDSKTKDFINKHIDLFKNIQKKKI